MLGRVSTLRKLMASSGKALEEGDLENKLEKIRAEFKKYITRDTVYNRLAHIPNSARISQLDEIKEKDSDIFNTIQEGGLTKDELKELEETFAARYTNSSEYQDAPVKGRNTKAIIIPLAEGLNIRVKYAKDLEGLKELWKNNHYTDWLNLHDDDKKIYVDKIGFSVSRDWGSFYNVGLEGFSLGDILASKHADAGINAWTEFIKDFSFKNIINQTREFQAKQSILLYRDALLQRIDLLPEEMAKKYRSEIYEHVNKVLEYTRKFEPVCPIETDGKFKNHIVIIDPKHSIEDEEFPIKGENIALNDMGWKQPVIENNDLNNTQPYLGLPHIYLGAILEQIEGESGFPHVAEKLETKLNYYLATQEWKIYGQQPTKTPWSQELATKAFEFGRKYREINRKIKLAEIK